MAPMRVEDIQDLVYNGFTDWEGLGPVSVTEKNGLLLFNYTREAGPEWNSFVCLCRGLIIDANTSEIVARPFDKFFNWLEGGRKAHGHLVTVTEKLDGSLGILYRDDGYKIATRGSFDGPQALWATDHLNRWYDLQYTVKDEWTLIFEIIYPENRVVVDYGDREDLVLLAVRNRFTGRYLPFFPDVVELAEVLKFSIPQVYNFNRVEEILEGTGMIGPKQEGWVAEFSDGTRWKFKGDHYLELHKLVSSLSRRRIISYLEQGTFETIVEQVPSFYQNQIWELKEDVEGQAAALLEMVHNAFDEAPRGGSRKDFALWVRATYPEIASLLFACYDYRPLLPMIYEALRRE